MEPLKSLFDEPAEKTRWWPDEIGSEPAAVGSANGLRYAYFPQSSRLAVFRDGATELYDTEGHRIQGVSQASGAELMVHDTRGEMLALSQFKRLN